MNHTERSSLAACIAHVAGASASDVPLDGDEQSAWLAERGLRTRARGGRGGIQLGWALDRAPSGTRRQWPAPVVMFGVPSGVIWDPGDTADEVLDGYVVAPLDHATWRPHPAAEAGVMPPERGPLALGGQAAR